MSGDSGRSDSPREVRLLQPHANRSNQYELSMCSQKAHAHRAHVYATLYTYTQPAIQMTQTDVQSTCTNSINSFIMLLSLAEQDRGLLVGMYIHTYKVDSSRRHSVCPVAAPGSQSPSPASRDMSPQGLQPLSGCWY